MAKAECIVVTGSLTIIVLFIVFSYLMTTVNPPRLTTIMIAQEPDSTTPKKTEFLNFYFRNTMDPSDDVESDMEKVNKNSSIPFVPLVPFYPHRPTNLPLPSSRFKNPNLVKVYPPIWVPVPAVKPNVSTFEFIINDAINSNKSINNTTTQTTTKNVTINSTITKPEIKDSTTGTENNTKLQLIQRRSINVEKNIDKDTDSIILRILDDHGKSRIEIKLYPNELFENKLMRNHRSFRNENKQLDIENAQQDSDGNTQIEILPNDTVVFKNHINWKYKNENTLKAETNETGDDFNITDINVVEKESNFTSKQPNAKEESITPSTTAHKANYTTLLTELNSTSAESLVLNVIYDNITRSFTDLNHNVSNNLTIFELK